MFGIDWLDPHTLIRDYGNIAVFITCIIVYVETGLLVGFFLPGDSLLFLIGLFLASPQAPMPLWLACILISTSAWLGDQLNDGRVQRIARVGRRGAAFDVVNV